MRHRSSQDEVLAGLTDPQREAVCHDRGPLLVIAGAGSGKTRVITRRIGWLLEQGVGPDRVIAITFTNKAAEEMRRRVEALVGEGVYVSTFHSFCARFLRRHISRLDRDAGFTIYDRADSLRLIRQAVREMELDEATYAPRDIMDYIAVQKDRILGPAECAAKAFGITDQTRAEVYRRYEEKLAANNAVDFDDLLLATLRVFSACPDVLYDYQEAYLHVLVDEYQDTNLPQHLIARALQGKHRNITAVGDTDQMIYSWRGARLENLLEFEQDFPGTRLIMLERNYRSTGNILRTASACISHNVLRHEKRLWSDREAGEAIRVGEFADAYAEGRWVAEKTRGLIEQGTKPSEIAVFYRTKQQSLPLEDAFAALTLPYQVVDSVGFFERREVKDLRSYLQLLVNPKDDVACLRVINAPARGIGAKTLMEVQAAAERSRRSVLEVVRDSAELDSLSPRARAALAGFWSLYQKLSALKEQTVARILEKLLETTEYVARQPAAERADVQEVVDMFMGYARQYDQRNPDVASDSPRAVSLPDRGLVGFLEQAALVSDVDGWNSRANAVPFMTLHSAKGLEFDAVFIVGLEEDLLPHRRALEEHIHDTDQAALEEERRLFYVGMTRARDRLFVTYARRRTVQGREQMAAPSRFLDELPQEGVERVYDDASRFLGPAAGFAKEMEYVLKKKRFSLQILDGGKGERLAQGVRVRHPRYGEGVVNEVTPMGSRTMVRVDFFEHGMMALILAPGDVAEA
jgi:DNA helicase-2/ATP-dependent DNA helicase PcrA